MEIPGIEKRSEAEQYYQGALELLKQFKANPIDFVARTSGLSDYCGVLEQSTPFTDQLVTVPQGLEIKNLRMHIIESGITCFWGEERVWSRKLNLAKFERPLLAFGVHGYTSQGPGKQNYFPNPNRVELLFGFKIGRNRIQLRPETAAQIFAFNNPPNGSE